MIVRLALVNVGDVQLDDRALNIFSASRIAIEVKREGGRIDDDAGRLVDRLVNPVDDLGLAVRLPEFDRVAARRFAAIALDLGERRSCRRSPARACPAD